MTYCELLIQQVLRHPLVWVVLLYVSRMIPSRFSEECFAIEKSSPTEVAGSMCSWSNTDGASISLAISPCITAIHATRKG